MRAIHFRGSERTDRGVSCDLIRDDTYPDDIREAVRLAVAARGTRMARRDRSEHVLVRAALTDEHDPHAILKDSGVKTEEALRALADGPRARRT